MSKITMDLIHNNKVLLKNIKQVEWLNCWKDFVIVYTEKGNSVLISEKTFPGVTVRFNPPIVETCNMESVR